MVPQETVEEKDLRVWVTNNAKPSNHVAHAVSKANQLLGLIKRTFSYMDSDLMRLLFTSVIRPHLEYTNVVWHPFLRIDIDLIERVQHRATKMVPSLSRLPYEERLKKMNMPSLFYRRIRGDVIEAYKYLHGVYDTDSTDLLPLYETRGMQTRGNTLKLQKRDCRTQLRQNFFSMRIVNIRNKLPEEIVQAPSFNCLKGRFDRYSVSN